jgi:hypothetical protein
MSFKHIDPPGKLKIVSVELPKEITVEAQFNPKEVSIDRSVPWQKQKKKGPADLEYTGGEPKTMSLELMFDGFEQDASVQGEIEKLHKMTDMMEERGDKARPTKVKVIWGSEGGEYLPTFEAVIESVGVKYTMFNPDGKVLRATANVKLKEAKNLKVGKPQ